MSELEYQDCMPIVDLEFYSDEMRCMTECERYGYTYGCDSECPVLMRGECKHAEEMGASE